MNVGARLIYYLLLALVTIGDTVLIVFSYLTSRPKKIRKKSKSLLKKFSLREKKIKVPNFNYAKVKPRRPNIKRAKKLKPSGDIVVLISPKRTKLAYFFYGAFFSLLFIFLPLLVYIFVRELPNPRTLTLRQIPQTTKIYDRNGILLTQIYSQQDRTMIPLGKIPQDLRDATIAIEDKNFYSHPGFDIIAMIRAARENISGRSFQGASTITQQLIKSSLLTNEISIERKVKEVILAAWAERIYDKDEILEMYFNQIPYGSTAWGAQAASQLYFDKDVSGLNLAESAFLAGITAAPTTYSPFGNEPTLWRERQKEVLEKMVNYGYISQKEADDALATKLVFGKGPAPLKAPHFIAYVKDVLAQKYGLAMVERGGLIVRTSLDLSLQEKAEKIVREEVDKDAYLNLGNGAAVVTDPRNGDILAMVGSSDYSNPKFGNVNIATSLQQPGSSIKVVTYAAALSSGFTAATILEDTPITYKIAGAQDYSPVNYDGRFRGRVPLRYALANSLNIPAIKTLNTIGVSKMIGYGHNMGIDTWNSPQDYGLSLALGAGEVTMLDMAEVYGTLANLGSRVDLNPILEVKDYKNTIYEKKSEVSEKVLPEGVAFIISDILADNQARSSAFGSSSPLNIPGHRVSVKTGTTDDKRDNWTIGYNDERLVVVWVGNNDNTPMSRSLTSGITGAAPIWNKIMTGLVRDHTESGKSIPEDIVTRDCFGREEYFLRGTEGGVRCSFDRPLSSTNTTQTN